MQKGHNTWWWGGGGPCSPAAHSPSLNVVQRAPRTRWRTWVPLGGESAIGTLNCERDRGAFDAEQLVAVVGSTVDVSDREREEGAEERDGTTSSGEGGEGFDQRGRTAGARSSDLEIGGEGWG
eukprot:scaffold6595_cov24-Tisochrysis_lutea.AAC.4